MRRIVLFLKYLKNNRILDYENIIKYAKQQDYEIIGLRDYIEKNYDTTKKLFILRHDVDHLSNGTKMMFEVEKKYGVRSSFYFRNATFEPKLMKEIEKYGSEASLHFEPIADFVKMNFITNKEELYSYENWEQRCLNILKANLQHYRNILDIPCSTIASHGEYENRLVGIANNFLTEDTQTYNFLNIKLEAYNKEMLDNVSCYISDVPIEINNGFRYGTTPLEALEKKEDFIMFLSHPNHWHYNKWNQFRKLVKMIIRKPVNIQESFKRI